jgi:uncharacterized YigZ family protein
MYSILRDSIFEFTEKKSKFITRIKSVNTENEAFSLIKEISRLEKGAVHNCYAFRIIQPEKTLIERKYDDGEPGGTAGSPMLSVLTGENLVNVCAVTSRYFGGIKLGTGGLVSAYKKGVAEILKICGKIEFRIYKKFAVSFMINQTDHVIYLFGKNSIKIIDRKFGDKVEFTVEIPDDEYKKLCAILENITDKIEEVL